MPARAGKDYLHGLRATSREIWLGDQRVRDVADHPMLAGGARSVAGLFDLQHEFANDCLCSDPESGEAINVSHLIPRSRDDLKRRRRGLERVASATVGMMGRSPDYCNVSLAGFVGQSAIWAGENGANRRGADNLKEFHRRARRRDLALTHSIVNPTINRSTDGQIVGKQAPLHKVGESGDKIIVRGSKVLATLAPYADELFVWPARPLFQEGSEPYALSFSIPMDTSGLIFLCRDSAASLSPDFDRPLSVRFDEQDAFVIFDDVEISKDLVFVDGDRKVYNSALSTGFMPNMQQQTTIRALTKLQFAYGLATRMAEVLGDKSEGTYDLLGELLCYVELTRSSLELSEEHAREYPCGVVFPDDRPLDTLRATMTQWMPRAMEIIMLIGSHNLLTTPSDAMFENERLRSLIDVCIDSADMTGAEGRAGLFRLAWDFVGSGLAARHSLYERSYIGSGPMNRRALHLNAQGQGSQAGVSGVGEGLSARSRTPLRDKANQLVDSVLAKRERPSEVSAVKPRGLASSNV